MASTSSSSSGIYFYMNAEGTSIQSGQYAYNEMPKEIQELNDFTITLNKVYVASMNCFRGYIVIDRELNTVEHDALLNSLSLHPEGDMAVSNPITKAEANVHLIAMKRQAPGCDPRIEQIGQHTFRCVMDGIHPDRFDQAIAKLTKEGRLRVTPLPMEESQFVAERIIYAKTPEEKVLSIWEDLELDRKDNYPINSSSSINHPPGDETVYKVDENEDVYKALVGATMNFCKASLQKSNSSSSSSSNDPVRYTPEEFKEFFLESSAPKK